MDVSTKDVEGDGFGNGHAKPPQDALEERRARASPDKAQRLLERSKSPPPARSSASIMASSPVEAEKEEAQRSDGALIRRVIAAIYKDPAGAVP